MLNKAIMLAAAAEDSAPTHYPLISVHFFDNKYKYKY
jgi:hypothetical protein